MSVHTGYNPFSIIFEFRIKAVLPVLCERGFFARSESRIPGEIDQPLLCDQSFPVCCDGGNVAAFGLGINGIFALSRPPCNHPRHENFGTLPKQPGIGAFSFFCGHIGTPFFKYTNIPQRSAKVQPFSEKRIEIFLQSAKENRSIENFCNMLQKFSIADWKMIIFNH